MLRKFYLERGHRLAALILMSLAMTSLVGFWDYEVTNELFRHPWPEFTHVMSRSLFEGEGLGVSDLGILVGILSFLWWLRHRRSPHPKIQARQDYLKFVFLSGIFAPALTVQILKQSINRMRPKIYFDKFVVYATDAHSTWLPGFVGWDAPRERLWNSFPSGHASSCALLLVFAYIFGRTRGQKAMIVGSVALFTMVMGIARCMAGMDWLSDSVAAFFIVWIVVDLTWWIYASPNAKSTAL